MRPGKPSEVQDLFNEISSRYDLLNDLFSFGLHRIWKKQLLTFLNPLQGEKWIDLCCGTGDLTISLAKLVCPSGKVVGIDSARKILFVAKKKASQQPLISIEWINSDLFDENLNLDWFDGVVMAYGLRNLMDPLSGLKIIKKLLKQGGRAGVLDFRRVPEDSFQAWFQKMYLRNLVVPISSTLGLHDHYAYLEESLKLFPTGKVQEDLAKEAGFEKATYYTIAGGQMGILLLNN